MTNMTRLQVGQVISRPMKGDSAIVIKIYDSIYPSYEISFNDDGFTTTIYRKPEWDTETYFAFYIPDSIRSQAFMVDKTPKFEGKYFRARVREQGQKQFKTMDAVGYTGMNKFKSDLRANGYMVSIVVEITNPLEMSEETFKRGSCIRF